MKTLTNDTKNGVAQGEILLIPVEEIPNDVEERPPVDGQHVVAHSETGHHHRILSPHVRFFQALEDPTTAYLDVGQTATLDHLREHDTHGSYKIHPGKYLVRTARESVVKTTDVREKWRKSVD